MENNLMKRYSISLATKEMPIKTTMRYLLEITKIKNCDNTKCWQDAEKLNNSYVASGSAK